MGIEVTYHRLTPTEFSRITVDQKAWDDFRGSGLPGITVEEIMQNLQNPNAQFNERLLAVMQAQSSDPTRLDISKDWHVIYCLLTGSAEIAEEHRPGDPLHNVIFGGIQSPVCSGYGPVRYFDEALVAQIATALSSLDRALVESRFDPRKFVQHGIYAAPDEEEKEIFFEEIERLCRFFSEAAGTHQYIIVYGH